MIDNTIFARAFLLVVRVRYRLNRWLESFTNAILKRYFSASSGKLIRGIRLFESEHGERWHTTIAPSQRLSIVIVTYKQPVALHCLLASLRCQTLQNFNVIFMHDGTHAETRKIVEAHQHATRAPCQYMETATRYNDYAHTLRDIGINEGSQRVRFDH